jgi:hypothetical protein
VGPETTKRRKRTMNTTMLAAYGATKKRERVHDLAGTGSGAGSMAIPEGGIVKLWEGYVGRAIRCLTGTAWVTQEGDGRDIILDPAEEFVIDREGVVVIQGLGPTRVAIR